MKITSPRLFMLVKLFDFYYEETFNSLFSVKNTFRSQPPNHNHVFGFISTLIEPPTISYRPSPLIAIHFTR